jgi:hypothetical protein
VGVRIKELPITAEKILNALKKKGNEAPRSKAAGHPIL